MCDGAAPCALPGARWGGARMARSLPSWHPWSSHAALLCCQPLLLLPCASAQLSSPSCCCSLLLPVVAAASLCSVSPVHFTSVVQTRKSVNSTAGRSGAMDGVLAPVMYHALLWRRRCGAAAALVTPLTPQLDRDLPRLATPSPPFHAKMERLGCSTAKVAGARQPPVPAVRVVGFHIPSRAQRRVAWRSASVGRAAAPLAALSLNASPAATHFRRAVPLRLQAAAQQQAAADQAGGGAASGPSRTGAAAGSSSASSTGPTFHLVCPICQTTELQLHSVDGRPTGSLRCPRCARTFDANATCGRPAGGWPLPLHLLQGFAHCCPVCLAGRGTCLHRPNE